MFDRNGFVLFTNSFKVPIDSTRHFLLLLLRIVLQFGSRFLLNSFEFFTKQNEYLNLINHFLLENCAEKYSRIPSTNTNKHLMSNVLMRFELVQVIWWTRAILLTYAVVSVIRVSHSCFSFSISLLLFFKQVESWTPLLWLFQLVSVYLIRLVVAGFFFFFFFFSCCTMKIRQTALVSHDANQMKH